MYPRAWSPLLSLWVSDDSPYRGPYRDLEGHLLHGIFLEEKGKFRVKRVISKGNLILKYRYPRIEASFQSPLVNDINQLFAIHPPFNPYTGAFDEAWMPDEGDLMLFHRVVNGEKPMGEIVAEEGTPFANAFPYLERFAVRMGLAARLSSDEISASEFPWAVMARLRVARREKFTSLFDLNALLRDHIAYAKGLMPEGGYLSAEERLGEIVLGTLSSRCVSDFMEESFDELPLVITGLILGYPLENTADRL